VKLHADCVHDWQMEWPDTDETEIRCQGPCSTIIYEPEHLFPELLAAALEDKP
jgi:hypothetical protein